MKPILIPLLAWLTVLPLGQGWQVLGQQTSGQSEHAGHAGHHSHNAAVQRNIKPPRVFLDKSPRIVEYQLRRLSNAQLLLIQTDDQQSKFIPVHAAIASRPGIVAAQREDALRALAKLRGSSVVEEAFAVIGELDAEDQQLQRVASELTDLLLQEMASVPKTVDLCRQAATQKQPLVRESGFAGLIALSKLELARELCQSNAELKASWFAAAQQVRDRKLLDEMAADVVQALDSSPAQEVRRQASLLLPRLPLTPSEKAHRLFRLLRSVDGSELRSAALSSLLQVVPNMDNKQLATEMADYLIVSAEEVPPENRTEDPFIDQMQVLDNLLPQVERTLAGRIRSRMREISVRVVRIKTVEEEMRYDTEYFAVEAGRPVQVLLENEDLMPHNLVFTQPGKLREVAMLAAAMPPTAKADGKQYVPDSEHVLFSTKMVAAGKQVRLTFDAPKQPGEYPFVCTFPNHWMRMYGVMVVVEDLDAFLANPSKPADPIGNNRAFVKNWSMLDFNTDWTTSLAASSAEIGKGLFETASCGQCHQLQGEGGRVGPDLTRVFAKFENDPRRVLQEILEPSRQIDPAYTSRSILTLDGQVFSGLIVAENDQEIQIISSPEQTNPTVIEKSEIEEMIQSPKSIMPVGLMDRFSRTEILELLAYLRARQLPPDSVGEE